MAWAADAPVPLWLFGAASPTDSSSDGNSPFSAPIFDAAGNIYGTTQKGGFFGAGTVFRLTPTSTGLWKETVLYQFKGTPDGLNPVSTLIRDSAGNLYGTTFFGGPATTNPLCDGRGCGVVFKLTPTATGPWKETIIHRFSGPDGANPASGLIHDSAGNFYGTTIGGGAGLGIAYKLTLTSTGWKETILHKFGDGADGAAPWSPLVFDSTGHLYGTTRIGGDLNLGTVYKLTRQSTGVWTSTVLHSFQGGTDGLEPLAGVVLDAAGNVYGVSSQFEGVLPQGTVFKLTAANHYTETVLHRFEGTLKGSDGATPNQLVKDSSGNLFGTTEFGGFDNAGTIFKLTKESTGFGYAIEYDFIGDQINSTDGEFPQAPMTFGPNGELFGTSLGPGFPAGGEVFKFKPF